jgi:DNA-binding transcriptional regulator YiaG
MGRGLDESMGRLLAHYLKQKGDGHETTPVDGLDAAGSLRHVAGRCDRNLRALLLCFAHHRADSFIYHDRKVMTKSVFSKEYERFRELLVVARKSAGLTQADVAARLGRTQPYVSKYEQGERRIDVIEFLEIAEAVKANPETLIADLRRSLKKNRK